MPASKAEMAAVAARRAQACELRRAGASYLVIAERFPEYHDADGNPDPRKAHRDISRALERNRNDLAESAELLRHVEEERLDRLMVAQWGAAIQGDTKAAELVLKIMDRRAKLRGLDAAIQHEVITVDALDRQIAILAEQLGVAVPARLGGPGPAGADDLPEAVAGDRGPADS